jgi:hypothetical protein
VAGGSIKEEEEGMCSRHMWFKFFGCFIQNMTSRLFKFVHCTVVLKDEKQ